MKWLCGLKISDTQTGLRGIPYHHIGMMCSVSGEKYEYETNCLIAIHSAGISLKEVPIKTIYENGNSGSHFNPIRDSVMIYKVIFSYSMTSIFTTLLDFIIFTVCNILGGSVWLSTAAGRFVASLFNFTMNKHAVFKSKGNTTKQ